MRKQAKGKFKMTLNTENQVSRRNALKLGGKLLTFGALFQYGATANAYNRLKSSSKVSKGLAKTATTPEWASGGTDLIKVNYPPTSLFDNKAPCTGALSETTTLGPCYFESSTGEDISVGETGLPMQLCLRLVDSNCMPLKNYKIEVWHCDVNGLYSGDTSNSADDSKFAGGFCTGRDPIAEKRIWYRGALKTDQEGRVNFKTCFPGWYRGRTIHIHVAVVNEQNQRELVTQFCFTDELCDEICLNHPLYQSRGTQDTPIQSDNVFPPVGYEDYVMKTVKNIDGSLLGYQTLQLTNV